MAEDDRRAREGGGRGRWLAFLLWSLVIFTLVPVANALRTWIVDRLGAQALFRAMVVLLAAAVAISARRLWSRRPAAAPPGSTLRRLAWIVGIAFGIGGWAWFFRFEAEPAHFVSYAILAVLAFRALQPGLRDHGVYPAAAALTANVGILDEIVQWLVPDRYWDLRDVAINAGIAVLVQLLIWRGLRPRSVRPGISPRSLRAGMRLLAVAAALLLLGLSNTPERTAWLAEHVPGLDYLGEKPGSRMAEYGHRIADPEIGRFASRLTLEELALADRERGAEAARILRRYRKPDRHAELRRLYPPWRDAFVYEMREHLSERARLRALAFQDDRNPGEARRLATGAYREALILERYFARALEAFGGELRPGIRQRLEELHEPEAEFSSAVANYLITGFSEAQARATLMVLLVVLIAAERYLSRRARREVRRIRRSVE